MTKGTRMFDLLLGVLAFVCTVILINVAILLIFWQFAEREKP